MITFTQKGDFSNLDKFLERALNSINLGNLDKYGREGVRALSAATPKDTGLASSSWTYSIQRNNNGTSIIWSNEDIEGGHNVALLLQYGHGTKNGGFVKGIDFINPAMRPLFERIADEAWKEVNQK